MKSWKIGGIIGAIIFLIPSIISIYQNVVVPINSGQEASFGSSITLTLILSIGTFILIGLAGFIVGATIIWLYGKIKSRK